MNYHKNNTNRLSLPGTMIPGVSKNTCKYIKH